MVSRKLLVCERYHWNMVSCVTYRNDFFFFIVLVGCRVLQMHQTPMWKVSIYGCVWLWACKLWGTHEFFWVLTIWRLICLRLSSHELVFPDRIVIGQSEELLTCDHIRYMRILLCIGLSRETLNLLIKKIWRN